MLIKVYEGSVEYLQVLDENGNVDAAQMPSDLSSEKIVEMYKNMSLARAIDAKALSLQRQGRAVTYAPLLGEEAAQVGSAMAMREGDYFVPSFRQHAVYLVRGFPLESFFIYWRGFEEGGRLPHGFKGLSVAVPVSTQIPHAVGLAFAQKYKNTNAAVIAYVGDGGTSEGDFYEGINFAGVFKVPLVVIVENNQWAISVPRRKQSAAQTLAQKGIAAGIKSMQVDGNDVFAMYKVTREAIEGAREGPTLIEAVTYRMSMHTTADDPTKYRQDSEVEEWKKKDPIDRLRKYLFAKNLWNDEMEAGMREEHSRKIDEAVSKAEQFKPDPKSMFENVYSFMPQILSEEEKEAVASGFWQGD